jgi:hypothetical protein
MQCAYCGATLKPGSKVCGQCGADVAPITPPTAFASLEPIPEAFPYIDPSAPPVEPPVTDPVAEAVTPAPASFADIPLAPPFTPQANNPSMLAIVSLILGVFSLCASFFALCGTPISIIGIIIGIISLKKPSTPRALSIAGIALNGVGLLLAVLFTILIGVMGYFSSLPGN